MCFLGERQKVGFAGYLSCKYNLSSDLGFKKMRLRVPEKTILKIEKFSEAAQASPPFIVETLAPAFGGMPP